MNVIQDLIDISRFYGNDKRYVIAGGGNTSYKNAEKLWVKASGHLLSSICEDGFALLDRKKLQVMSSKMYSIHPATREEEVKNDLADACITKDRRPSVETSMHNSISAAFVVHLHPTLVNALMCSQNAETQTQKLFGDKVLYIPYTDPGYVLFKEMEQRVEHFKKKNGKEPEVTLLQNHGIFVCANNIEQIQKIYDDVLSKIEQAIVEPLPSDKEIVCTSKNDIVEAISKMVNNQGQKMLKVVNNELIQHFSNSEENFAKISRPFTPDIIVYCKSTYIYIAQENTGDILQQAEKDIKAYFGKYGHTPKVILIKNLGLIAVGDSAKDCDIICDVYSDMMKIAYLAQSFGGEHSMTDAQIDFIDNWEVENYRRQKI